MNSEQRNEQELADKTVEMLESVSREHLSGDDAMTHSLSQQLRKLADDGQQEPNQDLRAKLLAQLDDVQTVVSPETESMKVPGRTFTWGRIGSIAASVMVLGLLAGMLLPATQQVREAARHPSAQLPSTFYSLDDVRYPAEPPESFAFDNRGSTVYRSTDKMLDDLLQSDGVSNDRSSDQSANPLLSSPDAEKWKSKKVRRAKYNSNQESLAYGRELLVANGGVAAGQYEPITENAFVTTIGAKAVSTFSIDVDTASYANTRRFIRQGQLPPPNAVRLEELINYFDYGYDQPEGKDPFSMNLELASCPWNDGHQLLRIGLQGKDVHVAERPPTNVVFLIDVSGSMQDNNKLPLLKRGFQMMVDQLDEDDRVSIVTYAGNAGTVLNSISGDQKKMIKAAIEKLTPGGSTHGSAGIELAYQLAQQNFIAKGSNKVILATDGDLNVGVTNDDQLVNLIKEKAAEGVFLTVLGFGTGNLKDGKLEKLADNGNGVYSYIDSLREAHKVLVQQLSGALLTIAKDVKIQIEFNPAEVQSYRLLGYENRALNNEDFDNDRKDAGEIGAGHSVTAIYELVPTKLDDTRSDVPVVGLKYQSDDSANTESNAVMDQTALSEAAKSGELATVAVRYKRPDANTSQRLEFAITSRSKSFATASNDFRFAASVAGFGMLLRGSAYVGDATFAQIEEIAAGAIGNDAAGYRAEFIDLVRKTMTLSAKK